MIPSCYILDKFVGLQNYVYPHLYHKILVFGAPIGVSINLVKFPLFPFIVTQIFSDTLSTLLIFYSFLVLYLQWKICFCWVQYVCRTNISHLNCRYYILVPIYLNSVICQNYYKNINSLFFKSACCVWSSNCALLFQLTPTPFNHVKLWEGYNA